VCVAAHKQPVKVAWTESPPSSAYLSDSRRKAFLDQISACGMDAAAGSDAPVLSVTIRFTPSKVLWIANFTATAGGVQIFVVEAPRASLFVARETSPASQLRAELLWRQERPLQSAVAWQDAATEERFLFLWNDGLFSRLRFEDGAWRSMDSAELQGVSRRSRSGEGSFSYNRSNQRLEMVFHKKVCDLNLAGRVSLTCGDREPGDRAMALSSSCEESPRYLAAGKGDYTQSDRITLGAMLGTGSAASTFVSASPDESFSSSVDMPGPVLDISVEENSKAAFAVVRNLLTGNYEVYRITAVCGN